jgi:transposase
MRSPGLMVPGSSADTTSSGPSSRGPRPSAVTATLPPQEYGARRGSWQPASCGPRFPGAAISGEVTQGESCSLRAVRGDQVGANPVDRAKPGSKLHLAVDGGGLPLSLLVTGANSNDSLVFEALLDDLPAVRTSAGRRRCRPEKVHADKAYDHRRCRGYLTRRGIKARIARCGVESSTRLGRHRWKVERSIAWLAGCRRLRIRYERHSERFFAFAMLACARLCFNRLPGTVEAHARSP